MWVHHKGYVMSWRTYYYAEPSTPLGFVSRDGDNGRWIADCLGETTLHDTTEEAKAAVEQFFNRFSPEEMKDYLEGSSPLEY